MGRGAFSVFPDKWYVRVIHGSSQNFFQANIDSRRMLRHIKVSDLRRLKRTIRTCHGNRLSSFLFLTSFLIIQRWNGGNIHGGGLVEERDRGLSCCEHGVFCHRVGEQVDRLPCQPECHTASSDGDCTDGGCTVKQVGPIRMSSKRPTQLDCLRDLGERIWQDHDSDCVTAAQA